ncbi:hypothetical protein [Herbaspirillum hiltneri]|uniref:hypothetical protein n=1 Tax=Herbaspirillum hiltneri TaxID=341045 RepID=UPI001396614A|nr:hypothetical protein [Herbaspirillum hiltneri]
MGEVFDIDDMAASMQSGSGRRHAADDPAEIGDTVLCAARRQAGRTHSGASGIT